MNSIKSIHITGRIFTALVFAGCLVFFALFFQYHIYFIEQLQIFIPDLSYVHSYLVKPAFLSSWIGDFLTQFYYLKGAGAVIIAGSLLTLLITIKGLIKKFPSAMIFQLLPLIPVIFSWIALCDPEFPLSVVISLIISVLVTLIYISIKSDRVRLLSCIFLIPFLYCAAGSGFYILTITGIFFELLRSGSKIRQLNSFILILITAVIPYLLKGHFLLTAGQAYGYLSEMTKTPLFLHYLPLISSAIVISAVIILLKRIERIPAYIGLQILVILVILLPGITIVTSFDLEKILRLDHEARNDRWEKVINLSERYKMRNNLSAYYTNMALSKLGVMPDELMEHYQPAATGLFIPVNANENYLTITLSNEVYWHLGDVNASQHSALLGMIFSPRARNSRLMKRLVKINIVNGEYAAAEKFITILEKTLFHRGWASEKRRYLFNEQECSGSKWIIDKRTVIPSRDLLKKGNEYVKTLRMLLDNNPDNRMAADYLLCFHLLSKDVETFASDFKKYYSPGRSILLPKVYQEGLLVNIAAGKKTPEDYKNYRFTPAIVKEMADYTMAFEENNGKGSALIDKYSKTYWFYYHFAVMKNE